jgi:hypothetical protein
VTREWENAWQKTQPPGGADWEDLAVSADLDEHRSVRLGLGESLDYAAI